MADAVSNKICSIEFIKQSDLNTGGGSTARIAVNYEGRGNTTADGHFAYTYDAFDRIVKIVDQSYDPNASTHPTPESVRCVYDYQGRRMAVIFTDQDNDGLVGAYSPVLGRWLTEDPYIRPTECHNREVHPSTRRRKKTLGAIAGGQYHTVRSYLTIS